MFKFKKRLKSLLYENEIETGNEAYQNILLKELEKLTTQGELIYKIYREKYAAIIVTIKHGITNKGISDLDLRVYSLHPNEQKFNIKTTIRATIRTPKAEHLTTIYISDIHSETINMGFGSLAIENLIKYAYAFGSYEITGFISPADKDHYDRLFHFYEKFGFIIDDKKRISKIIK